MTGRSAPPSPTCLVKQTYPLTDGGGGEAEAEAEALEAAELLQLHAGGAVTFNGETFRGPTAAPRSASRHQVALAVRILSGAAPGGGGGGGRSSALSGQSVVAAGQKTLVVWAEDSRKGANNPRGCRASPPKQFVSRVAYQIWPIIKTGHKTG